MFVDSPWEALARAGHRGHRICGLRRDFAVNVLPLLGFQSIA